MPERQRGQEQSLSFGLQVVDFFNPRELRLPYTILKAGFDGGFIGYTGSAVFELTNQGKLDPATLGVVILTSHLIVSRVLLRVAQRVRESKPKTN